MNLRLWHRWVSIIIAIPFGIIVCTGLILTTRGYNTWMQPAYDTYKKNSAKEMKVSFDQILLAVKSVPQAKMQSWNDISQIDARLGNIRVRSKVDYWEVQVDSVTGEVLGVGQRRVSWFSSMHEGAFFGPTVRYGFFVPTAIGVFFLLISGVVIFFQPYWRKLKARKKKEPRHAVRKI